MPRMEMAAKSKLSSRQVLAGWGSPLGFYPYILFQGVKGLSVGTKGKCPTSRVTTVNAQVRAVAANAESRIVRAVHHGLQVQSHAAIARQ